ncbi:MAG: phosphatase PAP2 family protein [Rectinemataceae bacterium]
MDPILAWGLDVVRLAQGFASPALTTVMKGISFLGSEPFYLIMLPILYWAVDRDRGARIALVFLASAFVNAWLKDLFGQSRPFDFDQALGLAIEGSHGLPSGHAQGSVVFFGMAAYFLPKPWKAVVAILFPLAIGVSRIYLGVHFPTDVLLGWGLGLLFLLGNHLVGERLEGPLQKLGERWRLILIAIITFGMNVLYSQDVSLAAAFLGAGFGFVWAVKAAPFSSGGSPGQRLGRVALGLALTVIVYIGPRYIAPPEGDAIYNLVRFFRYALVGFCISLAAPWIFLRLGLAGSQEKAQAERSE